MGKVSIGLRGWRFDEEAVFGPDGDFKSFDEMAPDVRQRVVRLGMLVGSPCHACWLIHGDENLSECNVARHVYGEALSEVVVCDDHEPDFVYWFREAGGSAYAGEDELQDRFHEWFADGGRAPEEYGGIDHVDTAPEDLPDPPEPDPSAIQATVDGDRERIDMRTMDVDLDADYPTR